MASTGLPEELAPLITEAALELRAAAVEDEPAEDELAGDELAEAEDDPADWAAPGQSLGSSWGKVILTVVQIC